MELLIAIMVTLYGAFAPGLTQEELENRYPTQVERARVIIDKKTYKIDPETGIVIIDETGN